MGAPPTFLFSHIVQCLSLLYKLLFINKKMDTVFIVHCKLHNSYNYSIYIYVLYMRKSCACMCTVFVVTVYQVEYHAW